MCAENVFKYINILVKQEILRLKLVSIALMTIYAIIFRHRIINETHVYLKETQMCT